jgi:hypothetical protein
MAYEVPPNAPVGELCTLVTELLNVVLSKIIQTGCGCLPDFLRLECLRDANEENLFWTPSAAQTCFPDPSFDDFKVFRNHFTTFKEINIPQD